MLQFVLSQQDNVDLGELMFSLCYLPTAGRLTITIIKARNLKAMDITGASGGTISNADFLLRSYVAPYEASSRVIKCVDFGTKLPKFNPSPRPNSCVTLGKSLNLSGL